MRVLIVASGNAGTISPFITDLEPHFDLEGIDYEYFKVIGKGPRGYLSNLRTLKRQLLEGEYDLIHAHYGLSGLLATLQHIVPVVTTFHGSDVNSFIPRQFSRIANLRSEESVFVSELLRQKLGAKSGHIIPCGVDRSIFKPFDKTEARRKLHLPLDERLVLFSSSFDREVKNPSLAFEAIELLQEKTQLKELKGMNRAEVMLWMNASDACLLTSRSEGSPQFIKECLACGRPIVSTNVGDVETLLKDVENCFITKHDPNEIAEKLDRIFKEHITQVEPVTRFDLDSAFDSIYSIYKKVLNER